MRMLVPAIIAFGALCACSENHLPDDELHPVRSPVVARVVSAQEALDGAYVPELDPRTMNDAEITKALGPGPYCAFRYTSAGKPVLAVKHSDGQLPAEGPPEGVVKLNGQLVTLQSHASPDALVLAADNVRLRMMFADQKESGEPQPAQMREADLHFEIDRRLRVGYRGYYVCAT